MAYVVKGKGSSWEIRQCEHTPKGPRSRTLATFSELTPEVFALASSRSSKPLSPAELESAARRAGAPVAPPEAELAARRLIAEAGQDRKPRGVIARLLVHRLTGSGGAFSDAQLAAADWLGATQHDRAAALVDLLLLTDALPPRGPKDAHRSPRFPRLTPAA